MKKILLFLFVVSVHCALNIDNCISQPVTWMRYYDINNKNEQGTDVVETKDSGFIILNSCEGDNLFVKINKYGIKEWVKTISKYYGTGSNFIQTSDSGFAMVVTSQNVNGDSIGLIKMDKNFGILWFKKFRWEFDDFGGNLVETKDGGFICSGGCIFYSPVSTKIVIFKTDSLGNLRWNKFIGIKAHTMGGLQIKTNDNNYCLTGRTFDSTYNGFVIKIDSNGNEIWTRLLSSIIAFDIKENINNDLFVIGANNTSRTYLAKLDSSGSIIFENNYFNLVYYVNSICLTKGQNIVLSGAQESPPRNFDCFAAIINPAGNLLSYSIISTPNDNYDDITGSISTKDNGLLFVGETTMGGNSNNYNLLIIKSDTVLNPPPFVNIKNVSNKIIPDYYIEQNYPNPFNPSTKIRFSVPLWRGEGGRNTTLKIFDILGREVTALVNENLKPGTYEINFDGSFVPSGIYFYKIASGDFADVKRMIILK